MTRHKTGTREEWPAARLALLEAERQLAKENSDDPRKGVGDGLSKVIGGN